MELNNLLTTDIQASHLLSPRGETESRAAVNPSPQCEAKETPHQGATNSAQEQCFPLSPQIKIQKANQAGEKHPSFQPHLK